MARLGSFLKQQKSLCAIAFFSALSELRSAVDGDSSMIEIGLCLLFVCLIARWSTSLLYHENSAHKYRFPMVFHFCTSWSDCTGNWICTS